MAIKIHTPILAVHRGLRDHSVMAILFSREQIGQLGMILYLFIFIYCSFF